MGEGKGEEDGIGVKCDSGSVIWELESEICLGWGFEAVGSEDWECLEWCEGWVEEVGSLATG